MCQRSEGLFFLFSQWQTQSLLETRCIYTIKHLHFELGHLWGSKSPIPVTTPLYLQTGKTRLDYDIQPNKEKGIHWSENHGQSLPPFRDIICIQPHSESHPNLWKASHAFDVVLVRNNKFCMAGPAI